MNDQNKIEIIREIIRVSAFVIKLHKKENLFEKCFQLFNLIYKCISINDLEIKRFIFLAISYARKNDSNWISESINKIGIADINLMLNMETFELKFASLSLILTVSAYPSIISDLSFHQIIISLIKILKERNEAELINLTLKSIKNIITSKEFHLIFKNNEGYIAILQIISRFNFNRIFVKISLEIIENKDDILGEQSEFDELIIKLIIKILQYEPSNEIIMSSINILSTIFNLEKELNNKGFVFPALFEKEGGLEPLSKLNNQKNSELDDKVDEFFERFFRVKALN